MKIKQTAQKKALNLIPEDNLDLIFSFLPSFILQRDVMILSKYFHNFVVSTVQERRNNNLFDFSIHRTCFHYVLPKKHQIKLIKVILPNFLFVYSVFEESYVLIVFNLTEKSKIFEKKFKLPIEYLKLRNLVEGDEELFPDADLEVRGSFPMDSNIVPLGNGHYLEMYYGKGRRHNAARSFIYLKKSYKETDYIKKFGETPWIIQQTPHLNDKFLLIHGSSKWTLYEIKDSKFVEISSEKKYFKLISHKEESFFIHENGIDIYDQEREIFEELYAFDNPIYEICEIDEQYLAFSGYNEINIFDVFNTEVVSKIKMENDGKISNVSSFGGYLICNSSGKKNELSIFEFDTL
jgi:hypothetical protein